MKLEDVRLNMEKYRELADEESRFLKDPHLTLDRMSSRYRAFNSEDRSLADIVIAEWVLSNDQRIRFDALVLIDEFKISTAAAALRTLASRLSLSDAPGAPYELKKVFRILGEFSGGPRGGPA
jgi:hypothetical protein